jgi:chemotaxis protein CheX
MSNPVDRAVLPPEVTEAFVSSAVTAVQELAQLIAFPSDGAAHPNLPDDSVIAVVRLVRPVAGTMSLVIPKQVARRISEGYLPDGTELPDEIIHDVVGELANVIAGQAKTMLKGTPYHFALSIPVVSRHQAGSATPGVAIPLTVEAGQLVLYVDLTSSPGS